MGGFLDLAIFKAAAKGLGVSDQGGLPYAISITVQPKLHISACLPWPVCFITSGAIQYEVPVNVFWFPVLFWFSIILLAFPKSASLQIPVPSTRTLAPLISLWITLFACRYSRPSKICLVYTLIKRSWNLPYFYNKECIDPPATYSKNIE